MTLRLLDLISQVSTDLRGIVIAGPSDLEPFITGTSIPIHRNRAAYGHEAFVTSTDGTSASLEDLWDSMEKCHEGAFIIILLQISAENTPVDELSESLVGAGASFVEVFDTVYPELPLAVVMRRSLSADSTTSDQLSAAVTQALVGPEGNSVTQVTPVMDPEMRSRLDRVRSETARMRMELRAAHDRADRAERQLARIENSTSMRVGRRMVEAAKSPKSSATLPRDVWRMWKLRSQRRRGTAPKPLVQEPTSGPHRDSMNAATGSQLLHPRFGMVAPLGQLSIVAVTSDSTAATLAAYAAVTRVRPHDAAQIMSMVDADLVLIDTAAAQAPSSWAHLGDPSATDRERALLELIDVAHSQGRPVVLVRSGDPSRSASLHALAERCDLVLTSSHGVDAPAWNVGVDLASAWLPSGDRRGVVFVGHLDARWSVSTRESLVAALRVTDDVKIHDWAGHVSMYSSPWPKELGTCVGAPTTLSSITEALEGRAVGIAPVSRIARGLLDPTTAAFLTGALRVVSPNDPNLNGFDHVVTPIEASGSIATAVHAAIEAGAPDAMTHRAVLREIFLSHATPVMLQRLVSLLGLPSRPLNSRNLALVTHVPSEMSASTLTAALLRQRIRPAELILLDHHAQPGFEELRAAGVHVHHLGSSASAEQISDGVDSPYVVEAELRDILAWPETQLLDVAIDFEAGFEGVEA
ncbi:MAG: hypothetical protein NT180_05355 [Actinobacteria bacterium]|nr:hypothetical protein [Actinomycetota bacterium]